MLNRFRWRKPRGHFSVIEKGIIMVKRIRDVSQSRRGFMRGVAGVGVGAATGSLWLRSAFAGEEGERRAPAIITS